jgi:hypothetical protein
VSRALASTGAPLEAPVRAQMQARLGHDFSRVRVHTDARAAEGARAVGAAAYTVGHDVVFDAGQYAPGSAAGRRLLAHELAHVAQQRAAAGGAGELRLGEPDTVEERQADAAARATVDGRPVSVSPARAAGVRVQRAPPVGAAAQTADRYPTAPTAWRGGIELYQVAEPEIKPLGTLWAMKRHIKAAAYKIVPVLVSDADQRVVYYAAYNTVSKRHDFAIGPDDLDTFIADAKKFEGIATLSLPWGVTRDHRGELVAPELAPWQVEIARMRSSAVKGDVAGTVKAYGDYTAAAVTDPGWWLATALGISSGLVVGSSKPPSGPKTPKVAAPEAPRVAVDAPTVETPAVTVQAPSASAAPPVKTPAKGSAGGKTGGGNKPPGGGNRSTGGTAADDAPTTPGMKGHDSPVTEQQLAAIVDEARAQPLVQRMRELNASAREGPPEDAMMRELRKILKDFEVQTGVKVVEEPNGALSGTKPADWGTRQEGYNYASLRKKPGSLLIEKQVFTDPRWLLDELSHELASYFTGGGVIFPHLEGVTRQFGTALWAVEQFIRGD